MQPWSQGHLQKRREGENKLFFLVLESETHMPRVWLVCSIAG